MLIHDRVQVIIKANNLTASEFASKIGIKRSNLSHVLSGRNKPSLDFLSKIITTYPKVNASWLITGETREGEFKNEQQEKVKTDRPVVSVKTIEPDIEKIVVFYSDKTFRTYSPNELA
ncbi:MAG: helix-turn-helix transcriptional regulator [Crocinitomicaceae bacterium]|nr:helix-turn-helix transcriptional regulator [Crocinitomicaceae bacterium]